MLSNARTLRDFVCRWSLLVGGAAGGAGCDRAIEASPPRMVDPDGKVSPLPSVRSPLARQAVQVVAEELGLSPSSIEVDSIRSVRWRDSSLGCPKPDRAYLQVVSPGHKITLRAQGRFYFVHESRGRAFLCVPDPKKKAPPERISLVWGPHAMAARRDLSARLKVPEKEIRIVSARPAAWTDGRMGCPNAQTRTTTRGNDGPVRGYVLTLRHRLNAYIYHTDLERWALCSGLSED